MTDSWMEGFSFRDAYLAEMRLSFGTIVRTEQRRTCDEMIAWSERYLRAFRVVGGWSNLWMAMRSAFLAEWHRALGTTYTVTVGNPRAHAVLTGITS